MVKADTRLWKETLEAIAYPALFLCLGAWIFKGVPPWQAFLGAGVVWMLRGGIQAVRDFKGLWRVEQRRRSAAKRYEWVPLASPQPVSDGTTLQIPFVISERPGWLSYLITPALIWGAILFFLLVWLIWFGASAVPPLVPTLLFTVGLTLPLSVGEFLSEYIWIEAHEEGLMLRTPLRRQHIPWQEARLFAIDATVETNKTPDKYELSSATTILRWSRGLEPSRWTKLSCPFPEYTRQMDALLALIAGRTGLPLYDLRDWQLPPLPATSAPTYRSLWRGE